MIYDAKKVVFNQQTTIMIYVLEHHKHVAMLAYHHVYVLLETY